jgi:hypothetical protein
MILGAFVLIWGYLIYRFARSVLQPYRKHTQDRPPNIARFELVMYLSIAVILIRSLFQYQDGANQAGYGSLVAAAIIGALTVLFAWLIAWRRTNWARWVFLIFFVLAIPGYAAILSNRFNTNPAMSTLSVVQLLLYGYGAYLLFTREAVLWFRETRRPGIWRAALGTLFKTAVLILSTANLAWLLYGSFFVGDEVAWVSLGLFMYGGIALLLLLVNWVAFALPGARAIPRLTFFIIIGGFSVFLLLPHKVVMF